MGMLTSDPRPVVESDPDVGAQQSFKAECDINNIMKKYIKTGMITHVNENAGRFVDVGEVGSYHEAVTRVRETQKFFEGLPTAIRDEFGHDVSEFLDFIGDPDNRSEVRRMGLDPLVEEARAPVDEPSEPEGDEAA